MKETLCFREIRFQKGDDDRVNHDDVHDRETCDDDHVCDCAAHYECGLPSSVADRAPSQAIRS